MLWKLEALSDRAGCMQGANARPCLAPSLAPHTITAFLYIKGRVSKVGSVIIAKDFQYCGCGSCVYHNKTHLQHCKYIFHDVTSEQTTAQQLMSPLMSGWDVLPEQKAKQKVSWVSVGKCRVTRPAPCCSYRARAAWRHCVFSQHTDFAASRRIVLSNLLKGKENVKLNH